MERNFEPNARCTPVCTMCVPQSSSAIEPARSIREMSGEMIDALLEGATNCTDLRSVYATIARDVNPIRVLFGNRTKPRW